MENVVSLKDSEISIINAVRKSNAKSKSELAELLSMPWSSLSNFIQSLMDKEIVIKTDESFQLNSKYAYFVGISFGSSRIKMVILDYYFELLNIDSTSISLETLRNRFPTLLKDYDNHNTTEMKICIDQTCDSLNDFYDLLNEFVDLICYLKETINIVSICIALPGEIDFDNQFIKNSYILQRYQNIGVDKFLTKRNISKLKDSGITYILDHNVKASIIGEREKNDAWSNCTDEHNFMCLYLGYGIGASYIINGKLFRGKNNEAGQLGHVQIIPRDLDGNVVSPQYSDTNHCRCGRRNCLEHRIHMDIFNYEIEDENGHKRVVDLKTDDINEIRDYLKTDSKRRKLLALYIGETLCNVILNLSIKRIVLSGKLSALFSIIENDLNAYLIENNLSDVILDVSNLDEYSAAFGAAIDSYMEYYQTSFSW